MADLVMDGQTIEAIVLPNGEELELGKNPTGNIDITQAGVTDVSEYATATVPSADFGTGIDYGYYTSNNVRKWRARGQTVLSIGDGDTEGWISDGFYYGNYIIFNAVAKNTSVTPSTSAQTIGAANTMLEGAVTVDAMPSAEIGDPSMNGRSIGISVSNSGLITASTSAEDVSVNLDNLAGYIPANKSVSVFVGASSATSQLSTQAATTITPSTSSQTAVAAGKYTTGAVTVDAMPSGTEGTPTATKGTVSNHAISVTPSVTNSAGYISGGTHTGTAVSVSASELVSGTVNITSSGNTDVTNYATASVASGSATASATKGTVSNHSVTVTPSVTRTAGYVTAGTASGTAVTVSASELVSGNLAITENGTDIDVSNYSTVSVAVEGGGGGGVQIGKTTKTTASAASSIQFTGLSGNPTSFAITSADDVATNTDGVTQVIFDGTSLHGQTMTTQVTADTGFTKSYSGGTLTVTATTASFLAGDYKLVYTYGGSASDIETADIQVGSGATSITFPVSGRPAYWSCIFKSDFSTSSGYQRVIGVVNDGSTIYGLEMDSSAHAATSWTATYSGGNLTINSQSTNVGGYFHQPGYYQLTYYVDSSAPQYESVSKTYRALTSAQSETITPSSGYDAIEEVSISVPAVTQTNLEAANIKQGTTITISNGQSNLWSVTGTYSGGGGTSKNTQVVQGTTRTTSSTLTAIGAELTVSKTGTYDIYWSGFRSSTSSSYTYATQLFIDNTAYGSENATWSNHVQNNHLTNVSLTANQKIRVRGRNSRGSSYYIYAPTLVIVES